MCADSTGDPLMPVKRFNPFDSKTSYMANKLTARLRVICYSTLVLSFTRDVLQTVPYITEL